MCKVDDAISVKPYLPLADWQYRGNSYLHSMKQHHTKTKGDLGVLKAQSDLSLRVISPKNNQKQGVHFAEDYLEVP